MCSQAAHGARPHPLAQCLRERGPGRLDDLLVTPLHEQCARTGALPSVLVTITGSRCAGLTHGVWGGYFSTYTAHLPNATKARCAPGFGTRCGERTPCHCPPACPCHRRRRRLDDEPGSRSSRAKRDRLFRSLAPQPGEAGHDGNGELLRQLPRRRLVTHEADLLWCGPDERDVRSRGARLREFLRSRPEP